MPDIAFIGEKTFLFEKLFQEQGREYQFVDPGILGSPFLPRFKMIIIPTGFANPLYSKTLPALKACRSKIADFVEKGGVLSVFGPLVPEHRYDWLPLTLRYVQDYRPTELIPASDHRCSCLAEKTSVECDGYLIPGERFETVLTDPENRAVLVVGKFGKGLVVATTLHEFPTAEYICWASDEGQPAKI